jgi:hypothetical protein
MIAICLDYILPFLFDFNHFGRDMTRTAFQNDDFPAVITRGFINVKNKVMILSGKLNLNNVIGLASLRRFQNYFRIQAGIYMV